MATTRNLSQKQLRAIEAAAEEAVRTRAAKLVRRRELDERREKRRVRAGVGASFLGVDASSTPRVAGAYTDPAGGGVADTPTPSPLFLPPQDRVVYNDDPDPRPVEIAWAPQEGPQYHFIHCPVTDVVFGGARFGEKPMP